MPSPHLRILRQQIDARTEKLARLHGERLRCRRGCSDCCADGLTVLRVEAEAIREHAGDALRGQTPSREGCAFLDPQGGCRVYAARPYVCRTQGLPLRWVDEDAERRDICGLNEAGPRLEELPVEACWTLGPVEERLVQIDVVTHGREAARVPLRALATELMAGRRPNP